MKLCECGCKKEVKETQRFIHGHNRRGSITSESTREKIGNKSRGRKFTDEDRNKMSNKQKELWNNPNGPYSGDRNKNISKTMRERGLMIKEKNHRWAGGNIRYFHEKARKLFGKDYCEICGKLKEQELSETNHGLGMHCKSNPKRYELMEESNWTTVCTKCHTKLDFNKRKLTEKEVLEIKNLLKQKKYNMQKIGRIYRVTGANIKSIRDNDSWSFLEENLESREEKVC